MINVALRLALAALLVALTCRGVDARDAAEINQENSVTLARFEVLMSDVAPLLIQFKKRGQSDAVLDRKLKLWRRRAEGLVSVWMQPGQDEFSADEIDESLLDHTVTAQHKLAYTLKAVDAALSSCPQAYAEFMDAEVNAPSISMEADNAYDDEIASDVPDTKTYRRGLSLLHQCRLHNQRRK